MKNYILIPAEKYKQPIAQPKRCPDTVDMFEVKK